MDDPDNDKQVPVHIELVEPAILLHSSSCKSGNENTRWEDSSRVTWQLHKGFYHERLKDMVKVLSLYICVFLYINFP
ncbi:hypothetical protein GIB67_020775 [Kingdonia uniflora]|uniref:Uncharacterized protein n=1 Tax=Kingdonia uniflora TaxID=39325 RepID=A0A7J7M769_9MAGN|nr:hypothetical protein GIB67_020775 [Kingdonia uniflora]